MENIQLYVLFRWHGDLPMFVNKFIPAYKTKTYLPSEAASKFKNAIPSIIGDYND